MSRKILIVDDNAINRRMLIKALDSQYDIIEAKDGKEAMSLLQENHKILAAVLLDIVMPEMDGYEVLKSVGEDMLLSHIPIIVVTSSGDDDARVKALSLGASDFILKPFNPDIVKHCLKNNIALRETKTILNAIQKDKLTGLYNREAYFERVSVMINEEDPGYYVLSCFDIDNFKLINNQYGTAEGDRILKEIGMALGKNAKEIGGIAGRISADNFSALFPADKEITVVLQKILDKNLVSIEQQSISFSIGRYIVTDLTLPASAIYDRAFIAKQSIKGRYDEHLAYFDDAMLEKLIRDQQITGEMEEALGKGQFEPWFQPQYNHATGELTGAEALARWRHPQKGIIMPSDFIPLFEENGFVYEMDKCIWRKVCEYLRKWIDNRDKVLPISVNISRYDIFRVDLVQVLTGLIEEFDIPVDMLHLEITESAFTVSSDEIIDVVKKLISHGFTVEIDDFGSGYSSLNTLKNVPAQTVKLDMKFLGGEDDMRRGGNILESIVRMTKWLGMTVLAEGVEELDQADFLKSIGCTYVQGYLYAKPMTASDFEKLLKGVPIERHPFVSMSDKVLFNDAFWDPKSVDSMVFNKYSGGACVYEFHNGCIEMVRVTDKYINSVFGTHMSASDVMKIDWGRHTDVETNEALSDAVLKSVRTNEEVSGEYIFFDLPGCPHETYLRTSLRVIASTEDRFLVYCTSINITSLRETEKENAVITNQLQAVMDNVSCGITAITLDGDKIEYLMINDRYYELLGYSKRECMEYLDFSHILSQDREWVMETVKSSYKSGQPVSIEYRVVKPDGSIIWMSNSITMTQITGIDIPVQISIYNEITEEKAAMEKLRISEEVNKIAIGQSSNVVCQYNIAKRTLYEPQKKDSIFMTEIIEEDVPHKRVKDGSVSKETADAYIGFYESMIRGEEYGKVLFQKKSSLGWRWIEAQFSTIFSSVGEPDTAVITYIDITENVEKDVVYKKWRQSLHDKGPASYSLFHCNISRNKVLELEEGLLITDKPNMNASDFDERTLKYAEDFIYKEDQQSFLSIMDRDLLLLKYDQGRKTSSIQYREIVPNDSIRWIKLTIDLMDSLYTNDVEAYLLFENIDQDKRAQLEIIERAETDPLTGVLNRKTFEHKINRIIGGSKPGVKHAFMMLDIDGFKLINDIFGHSVGDQTLIDVAEMLCENTRENDLVGRMGGDEFVIFLTNIPDKESITRKAQHICQLVRKDLSDDVGISASIGISNYPEDGESFQALYKKADATLYHVKDMGKDSFALYNDEMSARHNKPKRSRL